MIIRRLESTLIK